MERASLIALLEAVRAGEIDVDAAAARLAGLPAEDLGFARLDHQRPLRDGLPEAILAQGKTPQECATLAERIAESDLVLTGEGRLDTQSAYGKTVAGVAALAGAADVPCLAVAGLVEGSAKLPGLLDSEASTPPGMSVEEAMARTHELVPAAVERLLRRYSR